MYRVVATVFSKEELVLLKDIHKTYIVSIRARYLGSLSKTKKGGKKK
jgi:hypothetical protein